MILVSPVAGCNFNCREERLVTLKVLNQGSVIAINHILVFLLVSEILKNFQNTVHAIQQCLPRKQYTLPIRQECTILISSNSH